MQDEELSELSWDRFCAWKVSHWYLWVVFLLCPRWLLFLLKFLFYYFLLLETLCFGYSCLNISSPFLKKKAVWIISAVAHSRDLMKIWHSWKVRPRLHRRNHRLVGRAVGVLVVTKESKASSIRQFASYKERRSFESSWRAHFLY